MGKVSIIAAVAFSFIGYILLQNMQQASLETDVKQSDYHSSQIARELAMKGRKLLLAQWIDAGGGIINPIANISENGGTISMDPSAFSLAGGILDFKIRGTYNGAVHDIRSRFEFVNFDANPLQIRAADVEIAIEPTAVLDINHISLDDRALNDLESIIVDELNLGSSLSDFNLGSEIIMEEIKSELEDSGNLLPDSVQLMQQADRDAYDQQNGMFFPEQVQQAINAHLTKNPGTEVSINHGHQMPDIFPAPNSQSGESVLRIEDNLTIPAFTNVNGVGILIIEGNLIVQDDAVFNWEGLIMVVPPASNLNPKIHFIGETNISGSIVALQEAIPTSGHMDVTTFRDTSGLWLSPYGVDMKQGNWPWWLFHTHDYTKKVGTSAVFYAPTQPERIHESRLFFDETIQSLAPDDSVFFEYYNPGFHGRGLLTLDLVGFDESIYPVAPGFDPNFMSAGDAYRSSTFEISDLERLQLDITRLSSLRKMWDNTEEPFPDCTTWGGTNGAICVGETAYRQHALTLRMYVLRSGVPKRIYETSFYWHRQEQEEEDFEQEMDDYVDTINSSDFGLSMIFGDSTSFVYNPAVNQALSNFTGSTAAGMHNLGTWHQHWDADDPNNPLYQSP